MRLIDNITSVFGKIGRYAFPYRDHLNDLDDVSNFKSDRPIVVFFHIFAVNRWKEITMELVNDLRVSGLYNVCQSIDVTLITSSSEEDRRWVTSVVGDKCNIVKVSTNPQDYEFPALEHMRKRAVNDDEPFYALYIHTKGSGNSRESAKNYWPMIGSYKELVIASTRWRKFMSHYNIINWKSAVTASANGYDTYGANYKVQPPYRFYGGNFWWAKSEHVAVLPIFSEDEKLWRYNAETWLLSREDTRYYNACTLHVNENVGILTGCFDRWVIIRYPSLLLQSIRGVYKQSSCKIKSLIFNKTYIRI